MYETFDLELKRVAGAMNYPVRLGIIGGGQLARMTALPALPLGVEVVVNAASQSLCDATNHGECACEHNGDDQGGPKMSAQQTHRDQADDKLKKQN